MRPELTKKQKKLLDYLAEAVAATGSVPSLRTAAADLEVSHAAVAQTIKILEEKAYIRREGRYSRNIILLDPPSPRDHTAHARQIPVVGRITAGLPIYASQEWEQTILVDPLLFPGDNLFALRVQGQSMQNAGILDRDIVICQPRQYAHNREIVVALIRQEEATVKRFFLHPGFIELRPENPAFKSQTYDFDDVLIQGKVMGVVRPADTMAEGQTRG